MSRRGLCSFLDPFVNRINSLWTGSDQYIRVSLSDAETGDVWSRARPLMPSPGDRNASTEPSDCQQSWLSDNACNTAVSWVESLNCNLTWDARTVIIRSQKNWF